MTRLCMIKYLWLRKIAWEENMKKKLLYCGKCKEESVEVRLRTRKDGIRTRTWVCLNKGHGVVQHQVLGKLA